ncbi:MAG: hypothetical protein OSB58_05055 [Alphaproteobacteria bacterium]|nr:hypothetical protein [Alphaproteobacteria bacterium]
MRTPALAALVFGLGSAALVTVSISGTVMASDAGTPTKELLVNAYPGKAYSP